MAKNFMEFAFNDSVKKVQEQYGTRASYQRMENKSGFRNQLTRQEKDFIKKGIVFICHPLERTVDLICSFAEVQKDFLRC